MYKQRIYLWITVLLVIIIGKKMSTVDFSELFFASYDITINVDADTSVKNAFLDSKSYFNFIYTSNNPNMIIKTHSDETIDKYSKIENAIFSPMVLYIPLDYEDNSEFYYTLASDAPFVDFKQLADAIINDKTLGDLNISDTKKLKNTTIVLNIPSEGSLYYDLAIEQIYIALNNNVIPTEAERSALKSTVDALLAKTKTCNDIDKAIDTKRDKDDKTYEIYLGPEFFLNGKSTNYDDNDLGYCYYRTAYFEKSVVSGYDIFLDNEVIVMKKNLEDVVIDKFLNTYLFSDSSCYRTNGTLEYNSFMPIDVVEVLDIVP